MFEVFKDGPIDLLVVNAEDYCAEMAERAQPHLAKVLSEKDLAIALDLISGGFGQIEIEGKAVKAITDAGLLDRISIRGLYDPNTRASGGWKDLVVTENIQERIDGYVLGLPLAGNVTVCDAINPLKLEVVLENHKFEKRLQNYGYWKLFREPAILAHKIHR